MPRAETTPEPRGPMDLVSTLESDIARPDDFKRYVEGSRRLPEDPSPPVFARRQDPPREGTSKSWAATPLVPGPMPKSGRFPLTPAPQVPYPLPEVPDSSHRLLLLGLALLPVTALGLTAMVGAKARPPAAAEQEIQEPDAPLPVPPPAHTAARQIHPPAQITEEAWPTPWTGDILPAATWRAISGQEQRLIDRWDASREKSLGKASFEEWLDTQGAVADVDIARLKAKLSRDA